MQKMYENQSSFDNYWQPEKLVDEVAKIINEIVGCESVYNQKELMIFKEKEIIPVKQLFALYAINKITTISNKGQL